ncbi:hypothetical protein GCM10009603_31430 [Nocardiopsis exhalans]
MQEGTCAEQALRLPRRGQWLRAPALVPTPPRLITRVGARERGRGGREPSKELESQCGIAFEQIRPGHLITHLADRFDDAVQEVALAHARTGLDVDNMKPPPVMALDSGEDVLELVSSEECPDPETPCSRPRHRKWPFGSGRAPAKISVRETRLVPA